MKYCFNCGCELNPKSKFCGGCGQKIENMTNNDLDENITIENFESRDIDNYLNHLNNLIKSKNSVLNQDDLFLYEKTLRSLSESKFKKLYLPKFVGMKKVKDINDYLGIEDDITNKQLGRSYEGGKLPNKLNVSKINSEKKPWYKKWWGILIILWFLGILLRVIVPGPNGCECVKLSSKKSMGLYYDVKKHNSCIRKFGTATEMQRQCIINGT